MRIPVDMSKLSPKPNDEKTSYPTLDEAMDGQPAEDLPRSGFIEQSAVAALRVAGLGYLIFRTRTPDVREDKLPVDDICLAICTVTVSEVI
jgi:hypothetical protein